MARPVGFGLSYPALRRLLLGAGIVLLGIVAAVMYVRRVDAVEVAAILLFIPVFLGFVFFKLPGGIVAGALAAAAYLVLRLPSIDVLGWGELAGVIVSRAVAYLVFGAAGGWAAANLEQSLEKLDLYDQVDDATGLFNARFFVQDTELEMARAKRYSTIFSVVVADVPALPVQSLGRRRRARFVRQLGQLLGEAVRTVDRATHAFDGDRHRFAVVLPETASSGAEVFASRLAERLDQELLKMGAQQATVATTVLTYPDDEGALTMLRAEFASIDQIEHPESATQPAPP